MTNPVTQADRDAAFAVLVHTDDNNGYGREYIRDGLDDGNMVVQAFAAYCLAAEAAIVAWLRAGNYDSEMQSYANGFADAISRREHAGE